MIKVFMKQLLINDNEDRLGVFAIVNGKLYAKNGVCDFKENSYLVPEGNRKNYKCRKVIIEALINSLEATLKTGLRIKRIEYVKRGE